MGRRGGPQKAGQEMVNFIFIMNDTAGVLSKRGTQCSYMKRKGKKILGKKVGNKLEMLLR